MKEQQLVLDCVNQLGELTQIIKTFRFKDKDEKEYEIWLPLFSQNI